MGYRTYQRILKCAICGRTPDDGEPMWEMGNGHWCEPCCDTDHDEPPELFPGTNAALDRISIKSLRAGPYINNAPGCPGAKE